MLFKVSLRELPAFEDRVADLLRLLGGGSVVDSWIDRSFPGSSINAVPSSSLLVGDVNRSESETVTLRLMCDEESSSHQRRASGDPLIAAADHL